MSSPLYKDYDLAIEQYDAAATLEPRNVECHLKLANLYEIKRDFDQAIKIYKKILKHDNNCFKALMKLGLVQIRNDIRDKGLQNLKLAYKIDPEDLELKIKLADVYIKNGNIGIASDLAEAALEQDPNNSETHYIMGKVYQHKDMVDEALDSYKTALTFPH